MIDGYVYRLSSLRTEEGFVYLGETSTRSSLYCFHFAPVVWLHVADIYIYITFSPAVHAVCTQMNSPLPWPNTCFCVPATCVCGCHCILNCVYVLKCRNTINVARQYNMCMSSQIVCVNVPMPEWNMCAHTFCMSILVVVLWHVVVSWHETEDMQQVVWVGAVVPRVI